MNGNSFVKTRDTETADLLKKVAGLNLLSYTDGVYTFLNCQKMDFVEDKIDKSKLQYTNILHV